LLLGSTVHLFNSHRFVIEICDILVGFEILVDSDFVEINLIVVHILF
jgi:hypothetical protein